MASSEMASPLTRERSLDQQYEKRQQEIFSPPSDESKETTTQDHIQQPAEEHKWVTGITLLTIMGAICLVCFLMLLDTSIIATAIPKITSDFHSLQDVGWYGSSYQLASAALVPLTGKLYVNFDSKRTFLSFFAIFELGSLLCGVATSSKMLIVGRAVAGIGASGIQNGAFTIIAECVPMPKRPALIGFVMGVSQLGLVVGPLIGGILTQYTTWRWCFYVNLPIGGLVAAALSFVNVPTQTPKPKVLSVVRTLPTRLDLVGFAIFAPAAIQLLLAVQFGGNQFAWNSSTIIGLFCGAGATFIIFLVWDYYKGEDAMIPLSMLCQRSVWSSCLVYGFLMSQMFTTTYYLPIYFQAVKGVSPTLSGVYLLPLILSQILCAIGSGTLVGWIGYYLPVSLFSAVLMAIGNGLLSTLAPGTSTGKWIGFQILLGAGSGSGLQMPIIAVQNTLPPQQIPIAMALIGLSQTFGGALFLSLAGTIFTNSLRSLIETNASDVNPEAVIAAGATGFRKIISGNQLAAVLVAYAKSVDRVFYLTAGAGVSCFAFAWGMGWKDIRKKNEISKACHRLNKECRPSATVRRRNPKKPAVSKSARLEEKLDGLVSLLKAGAQSDAIAADTRAIAAIYDSSIRTNDRTSPYNQIDGGSTTSVLKDYSPNLPVLTTGKPDSRGTLSDSSASLLHDASEPSALEAEEYLTAFRTFKSKYIPFVYIASTTSAHQLRQDRPFLWLCIMMIASSSTSQQQVLSRKVRDTLSQEMLLKSGQNIDLLLGLLAYIAWINYQVHSKPSLSVFTQLATALVFDLGLNKPPGKDLQVSLCISPHKYPKLPTVRTMEERRAVLGCFLITSIVSSFLQKIDALRWTLHMEDCLQVLDELQECPSDETLVQQVRLQLIVEKVNLGNLDDEPTNTPLSSYLLALHSQLHEVKAKLPPQSQCSEMVLAHLYSTEMSVNEMALLQMPIGTKYSSLKQIELLFACVESIKSWFEVFFTISLVDYIGFPFSLFSQLVHCLVNLYRLSTLDDPAWDKTSVRKTADLLLIVDRVVNNMEQAAARIENNDSPEGDVFSRTAKKFRSLRPEWEAKLWRDDAVVFNGAALQTFNETPLSENLLMDSSDNDWMMDFLLAPNY